MKNDDDDDYYYYHYHFTPFDACGEYLTFYLSIITHTRKSGDFLRMWRRRMKKKVER
jgi:hypothetical protein